MMGERYKSPQLACGSALFEWGQRTYVMGIINVSPDSFSGDGLQSVEAAVRQGIQFAAEGADILDIGGESTRPASTARRERRKFGVAGGTTASLQSVDEELSRVIPVIERLVNEVSIPISVDTYKSQVADRAVEAGASMINDVWGLTADPDIARVAAEHHVALVLMHNQETIEYNDLMVDVSSSLQKSAEKALSVGVPPDQIILDPGFGFGKTPRHNLMLLRKLGELDTSGYPLLVGTSRKSTIGLVLDLPANERIEGTAATVTLSIVGGADIVRVHDVREMVRVARMTDAVWRNWMDE